ncbi:MAG: hypothetical protein QXO00_04560 [Candidatus Bathyarchaeia archaeon]
MEGRKGHGRSQQRHAGSANKNGQPRHRLFVSWQRQAYLDTIIETNKGAIGRSVEKEIEKPFIMIGSVNSVLQNFVTADFQDLVMKGYKEGQEFIEKAESLCERFFGKGKSQACGTFGRGFMFAFLDDDAKLEVLIAENSKIVYRARAMTFISNKNRIILKTLGKTVVANSGRAIVLLSNFAV